LSEVVEEMREATSVQAVNADVGQTAPGGTNTIAFSMSFDYRDPNKAQAVMQSYVQRFLEIDTATSAEQATSTVAFLQDQANTLQRQIAALEGQITQIKARNGAALASSGVPMTTNSGGYDAQIASLQSENRQLLSQARRPQPKNAAVAAAEAQLAVARATYSDNHPDVALAQQRLEEIRRLARNDAVGSDDALIQAQIAANNATIAALGRARSEEASRASSTLSAQSRAPVIMEQVMQLDNRANTLRLQYQDVSQKLLSAQNSARMAQEQKGERLSVIDPPVVPDKPTSPNRLLLIIGGIIGGLGLGLGLALMLELILRPVRGVDQIGAMGLEPLAVVPTFSPDRPKRRGLFGSGRSRPRGGLVQS
jgi:uncharacterized protein involved in exopolysaccharide biosynthesis